MPLKTLMPSMLLMAKALLRTDRARGAGLLFAGWLAIAAPAVATADETSEARAWLDRMAMAVNHLDYRGVLVYIHGDSMDAMKVFHRVQDGNVRERLISLTGPHREVLRDADTVRCILPDEQSVVIDTRIADPWFPVIPPEQVADPGTRYRFALGGIERVAGLPAQVLHILPKDRYRYGYQLWLENNTGMLLKSHLLDERRRPVEQLMFTELTIGATISDTDLQPGIAEEGYMTVEFPQAEAPTENEQQEPRDWWVSELPAGFTLRSHTHQVNAERQRLEHLVFTDGLATVSVYVEPSSPPGRDSISHGEIGPINLYGVHFDGYSITAIGEVPPATVQLMAHSVRPRQ